MKEKTGRAFSFMMLRSWWQATICAFCMHLSAPTEFCVHIVH